MHKAAWAGGETVWPKAYAVMRNMGFDTATYAAIIASVEVDGKSAKEAAGQWIDANEAAWSAWAK